MTLRISPLQGVRFMAAPRRKRSVREGVVASSLISRCRLTKVHNHTKEGQLLIELRV